MLKYEPHRHTVPELKIFNPINIHVFQKTFREHPNIFNWERHISKCWTCSIIITIIYLHKLTKLSAPVSGIGPRNFGPNQITFTSSSLRGWRLYLPTSLTFGFLLAIESVDIAEALKPVVPSSERLCRTKLQKIWSQNCLQFSPQDTLCVRHRGAMLDGVIFLPLLFTAIIYRIILHAG